MTIQNETHRCSSCKKHLPVSQFYKSTMYGYQSACKQCQLAKKKIWREKNKIHEHKPRNYIHPIGVKNGRSILNNDDVRMIRALYEEHNEAIKKAKSFGSFAALAEKFGVSEYTIKSIINRNVWTHL